MLRLCAFMCLLAMTLAIPRRQRQTTLAPTTQHRNEDPMKGYTSSKLGLIEELMRGYTEHGPNKDQETPVRSIQTQPSAELSPAFLAEYEEQDFTEEDFSKTQDHFGIPGQDYTKPVGEYPGSVTGTTGTKPYNNQQPESTVPKEALDNIHSNAQAWFDSLAESAGKFSAEDVASFRGIPGVNFPDYEDIPSTPFTCFDKQYLPGFYADMDTGCQVFHMCFENRKVSFLCPVGTVFNQALLTCDYWHHSDCSRTPLHYSSNVGIGYNPNRGQNPHDPTNEYEKGFSNHSSSHDTSKGTPVPETQVNTPRPNHETDQSRNSNQGTVVPEVNKGKQPPRKPAEPQDEYNFSAHRYLDLFLRFFPIKAKVTMFPENGQTKVEAITSIGDSMKQRITVYPVANNSKVVAEASIGERRRQNRPQVGGYSAVNQAPERQNQKKGKDIDQSVFNDIDDAFAIVRRVLEHVGRLLPRTTTVNNNEESTSNSGAAISGRRSSCRCRIGPHSHDRHHPGRPKHCRCHRPLTALNPRFIVKPVVTIYNRSTRVFK
ncbi:uncharacterized protein LOC129966540 [Argiope bruennichi]|uniref:uncharacterized protein LOC129966540 n=1 Tax=Argiope bruennichi TaxID=94029 RepID=UPI002494AF37|nr:uncharacterized protein LOC129966540 [Argiope bruennichi]